MKIKTILPVFIILSIFSFFNTYAAEDLPLTYTEARYSQGDDSGTNIWYSVIPSKYKMHYSYGKDQIHGLEKPTTNAKRHHATLAINAEYMGLVDYNGTLLQAGADVSQYDFYMKPNTEDSTTAANLYATSPTSTDVGIDLSYAINPRWCTGMCFVTMIRDGIRVYDDENNYSGTGNLVERRHPRTWIAIDSEGNQFVAVSAGRDEPLNDTDFSLPQAGLTFDEIIAVTHEYFTTDIKYLYNLDGGGSSAFVYKGNMLNPKYDDNFTTEREVRGIYYWKVDDYTIEYDLDGGILPANLENPEKYNVDTNDIKLNNPVKDGYEFTGWIETIDKETTENIQKEIVIAPNKIGNRKYVATYKKIDNIKNPVTSRKSYIIIFGVLSLIVGGLIILKIKHVQN